MGNDPDRDPLESLRRLVSLYEAWSRPDDAGRYRAILDQRSGASEPNRTTRAPQ
jgi:hypothetical protein